jgi:outer membrane protein
MTWIKRTLAGLFLLMTLGATAQMKIAHINQAELLEAMPQTKVIEDSLQKAAESYRNELQLMMADIQELEQWLIDNPAALKAVKESKQALLLQLKINAQEFTQNAESELAALQDTLLAPLVANIKKAIDEVCVEKGYNYVFDTSLGNPIFTDPKHDILADVKRKLNIQQ